MKELRRKEWYRNLGIKMKNRLVRNKHPTKIYSNLMIRLNISNDPTLRNSGNSTDNLDKRITQRMKGGLIQRMGISIPEFLLSQYLQKVLIMILMLMKIIFHLQKMILKIMHGFMIRKLHRND